jgi:hypothetical protein
MEILGVNFQVILFVVFFMIGLLLTLGEFKLRKKIDTVLNLYSMEETDMAWVNCSSADGPEVIVFAGFFWLSEPLEFFALAREKFVPREDFVVMLGWTLVFLVPWIISFVHRYFSFMHLKRTSRYQEVTKRAKKGRALEIVDAAFRDLYF